MTNQAFWQFHCPECGFGDGEHGQLLTAEEIYCMVCSEEQAPDTCRLSAEERSGACSPTWQTYPH
jgi:hypothetical protein